VWLGQEVRVLWAGDLAWYSATIDDFEKPNRSPIPHFTSTSRPCLVEKILDSTTGAYSDWLDCRRQRPG
jgi:hypothetical protein